MPSTWRVVSRHRRLLLIPFGFPATLGASLDRHGGMGQAALHLLALTFDAGARDAAIVGEMPFASASWAGMSGRKTRGRELLVMSRVGVALLAACWLGLPLTACSRSEPPQVDFKTTRAVKETPDPQATLLADQEACTDEARRKGISSVTRILLLRGKISKSDYVSCMKDRGYDVPE